MKRRTFSIYLYRLDGHPIYVGQTPDLERRHRHHAKHRQSSFERLMAAAGPDRFTLEVIAQVECERGDRAPNDLENAMMDRFGTYKPGFPGYNQRRAGFVTTEESLAASHAATAAGLRGRKRPLSVIARLKAARAGWKPSRQMVEAAKRANRGLVRSPETVAKMSAAAAAAWRREDVRERRISGMHRTLAMPETRQRFRSAAKLRQDRHRAAGLKFGGRPLMPVPNERITELLSNRWTWAAIAEELGCSRCTIWNRIKRFGLAPRRTDAQERVA